MVKMKCKCTGWDVTVQPSLAEKGYWLVTYFGLFGGQYIHTFEEVKTWYENN